MVEEEVAKPTSELRSLHAKLRAERRDAPPPPAEGVEAFIAKLQKTDPKLGELFRDVIVTNKKAEDASTAVDRWTAERSAQRSAGDPDDFSENDFSDDDEDDVPRSRKDEAELLAVLQSAFVAGGLTSMPTHVVERLAEIEGILVDRADEAPTMTAESPRRGSSERKSSESKEEETNLGTPLHREVYCGSFSAVRALFRANNKKRGKAMLEVRDHRGNTPLLLALKRGRADVASFLVHAGADVDVKSDEHFHLIDDAVSLGDVPFVRLAHGRLQQSLADRFDTRREMVLQGLSKLPDFILVMECKLTTTRKAALLAPLVSAMRIGDTYTIRKRGTWLRADSTASGIDMGGFFGNSKKKKKGGSALPSVQRGSISLVMVGRERIDDGIFTHKGRTLEPGDVLIVDRIKRTADSLLRRMRSPTPTESNAAVKTLLKQSTQPLYSLSYKTDALHFETKPTNKKAAATSTAVAMKHQPPLNGGLTRHVARTEASVAMYQKSGVARLAPLSEVDRETYFDPEKDLEPSARRLRSLRKRVEVRVDTTDDLPIGLSDILPVLEIASMHDDPFFAKMKSLLESSTLPMSSFPKRIKVPLLLGVAARADFTTVKKTTESAAMFKLPDDITWSVDLPAGTAIRTAITEEA